MIDSTRGVLFPSRLPTFHRLPPPPAATDLVVWFWIPEWNLPAGVTSRQDVVAYPALNLVVEPHAVSLAGATTKASHRDINGDGWAVGALLRPAATAALTDSPAEILDKVLALEAPELHDAVSAAMATQLPGTATNSDGNSRRSGAIARSDSDSRHAGAIAGCDGDGRRAGAVAAFSSWLAARVGTLTAAERHANKLGDVFMGDDPAQSLSEAAARLAVSERTLQRMAHRYVGITPAAMIRRRRLQDAAERLRANRDVDLSTLASELGYADHAHLTRDFRVVLGMTPTAYRDT